MKTNNCLLMVVSVILSANLAGCMRYHHDEKDYTHNTVSELTEESDGGGVVITTAGYREWGVGAGIDGEYGTKDDDVSEYRRVTLDKRLVGEICG